MTRRDALERLRTTHEPDLLLIENLQLRAQVQEVRKRIDQLRDYPTLHAWLKAALDVPDERCDR